MKLKAREKKVVIVGLVLSLFILLGKFVAFPLKEQRAYITEAIEAKQELLVKYQQLLRKEPAFSSRENHLREGIQRLEERLIPGETPTLVSAELQSVLEEIAKRNNAGLKSIRTGDTVHLGDYSKVSLEMTFVSDVRALLNFLYDIENSDHSLSIVHLDVHFQGQNKDRRKLRTILQVEGGMKNLELPDSSARPTKKKNQRQV